jgi:threonine dehydrogenase-like Zn-dependent dehydrogenase
MDTSIEQVVNGTRVKQAGDRATAVSTRYVNCHMGVGVYAYLMNMPGHIRLGSVPDPDCKPDEILMETEAVSICSTDVSYFRGHLFPNEWPVIPGHEYVGRVVEVGSELRDVANVGDRICYWGQTDFGGMAEFRSIRPIFAQQARHETSWYTKRNFYDADQAAAVLIPPDLPSTDATIIEPLTSVLRSLLVNPPQPGDDCVVLGCGPSAQLAVQVLIRHLGARSVLVVDRNDYRIELARTYGANLGFNMETQAEELEQFVHDHNDHYADYVFDALPHVFVPGKGKDVRELGMGLLRPGGLYVIYGAAGILQQISTWMILAKGLRIQATPFDVRLFSMSRSASVARLALRLVQTGLIDTHLIVPSHVAMTDEASVREAFHSYGHAREMKTSFVTNHAMGSELANFCHHLNMSSPAA